MKVNFKVNLGSRDAERFGLDFGKCQRGMSLEVADHVGEWLIGKGIAGRSADNPAKEFTGVAAAPAIAEAAGPGIAPAKPAKPDSKPKNKES